MFPRQSDPDTIKRDINAEDMEELRCPARCRTERESKYTCKPNGSLCETVVDMRDCSACCCIYLKSVLRLTFFGRTSLDGPYMGVLHKAIRLICTEC